MTDFPYKLHAPSTQQSTIGLAVLQTDETIEHDFQRLMPTDMVRQFVTRVANKTEISADGLAQMVDTLPNAIKLFPGGMQFDVVGYGCTSATSVIGVEKVGQLIRKNCTCIHVTDPLSALIAACAFLDISNLAFLSPYVEEVSHILRKKLNEAGIQTPVFGSFNEAIDSRVANIDEGSLIEAALDLGADPQVEAIFLSCTNLKTLDVISEIENQLTKPVLSSNSVLAWHMAKLADFRLYHPGFGTLLANEH